MPTNIDNIKAIYKLATAAERVDGTNWYPIALDIAETLADEYDLPGGRLASIGVIAALSPRNKWSRMFRTLRTSSPLTRPVELSKRD